MTFNEPQLRDRTRRTYLYCNWMRDATRNERAYRDACQFWQTQLEQYVERSGALLVTMSDVRTAFTHVEGDIPSEDMIQHLFRRLCRSDLLVVASKNAAAAGSAVDVVSPVAVVPKSLLLTVADSVAKQTAPSTRGATNNNNDQQSSSWLGWAAGAAVGVVGSTWNVASSIVSSMATSGVSSSSTANSNVANVELAAPVDVVAKSSEFVVLSRMQQLARQLRESFELRHSMHSGAVQRVLTVNDIRELLRQQQSTTMTTTTVNETTLVSSNENIELLMAYLCVSKQALRIDLANGQRGIKLHDSSAAQAQRCVTAEDVSILALKNARATLQHQQSKADTEISKCQQQALKYAKSDRAIALQHLARRKRLLDTSRERNGAIDNVDKVLDGIDSAHTSGQIHEALTLGAQSLRKANGGLDASAVSEQMVEIEELLVDQQQMLDAMGARATAVSSDDEELERELDELDKDIVIAATPVAAAAAASASTTSSSLSNSSPIKQQQQQQQTEAELDLQKRLENLKVSSNSPTTSPQSQQQRIALKSN